MPVYRVYRKPIVGGIKGSKAKPNLITNGSFDTDTTGWTANTGATIASVAGGQAGNCLRITGSFVNAYQILLSLAGSYTLTIYHKNGTGQGYVAVGTVAGGTDIYDPGAACNDVDWTKYVYTFTRTGIAVVSFFTWTGGTTTFFDEVTLTKN